MYLFMMVMNVLVTRLIDLFQIHVGYKSSGNKIVQAYLSGNGYPDYSID